MTDPTVLRVTGHASLTTRADAVAFTVTVHRCADTAGRARRAAATGLAAVDRVLSRHAPVVLEQHRSVLTVEDHPEGGTVGQVCGRVEVAVTATVADRVADVLVALRRVAGVEVGPVAYRMRDAEKVRHFARKAAVADAQAAARSTAETLDATVATLDWVVDTGAPTGPAGDGTELVTEATVTAQFTVTGAGAAPATGTDS